MDRQLGLNLESTEERVAALRAYIQPLKLPQRAVDVLCLLVAHGDLLMINGQSASKLSISKKNGSAKIGCAPNTFVDGVAFLRRLGVLDVLATTKPITYLINWSRVGKLTPPSPPSIEELQIFSTNWSPTVTHWSGTGQEARDSVSDSNTKIRGINRDTVIRDTGQLTELDRPWSAQNGITGDELVMSVTGGDLKPLRRLYDEAIALGWIDDSEDAKQRFLTLCHHCATTAGINNRMAVLVSRVKAGLKCDRTRIESDEWARKVQKVSRTKEREHELG